MIEATGEAYRRGSFLEDTFDQSLSRKPSQDDELKPKKSLFNRSMTDSLMRAIEFNDDQDSSHSVIKNLDIALSTALIGSLHNNPSAHDTSVGEVAFSSALEDIASEENGLRRSAEIQQSAILGVVKNLRLDISSDKPPLVTGAQMSAAHTPCAAPTPRIAPTPRAITPARRSRRGSILYSTLQTNTEKLRDVVEDAALRAVLAVDAEHERLRKEEMLNLMRFAASQAVVSATMMIESESVDANGQARGLGFRSLTAGLKKADVRMKNRTGNMVSSLRHSIGIDGVRRLSAIVNSPNNFLAAAASAAANAAARSPDGVVQYEQHSDANLKDIVNAVVANIQQSINTILEDDENEKKLDEEAKASPFLSTKPKLQRTVSSSSVTRDSEEHMVFADLAIPSGTKGAFMNSVGQKKQRRKSVPPAFTASEPQTSDNTTTAPKIEHGNPLLPHIHVNNILKAIQSETFIESSGYHWAKHKKQGHDLHNSQHDDNSVGKSSQAHSTTGSLIKKKELKVDTRFGKKPPIPTNSSVVTLKMTAPIVYKKNNLTDSGHFAAAVREESKRLSPDSQEPNSFGSPDSSYKPQASRFRIIKLLKDPDSQRNSRRNRRQSDAAQKQTPVELEAITLSKIMRPTGLRSNMVILLSPK